MPDTVELMTTSPEDSFVRNGLAHRYDTSMIDMGAGQCLVVVITWKNPRRHLEVESRDWLKDGVKRLGVWLDMETMWNELKAYLRKMDAALRADQRFSRLVTRRGVRLDRKYTVRPDPNEDEGPWRRAWEEFVQERRVLTAAKVRYRAPEQLRHSFASAMLSRNAPLLYVQQQGGWRSANVLLRVYARCMPQDGGAIIPGQPSATYPQPEAATAAVRGPVNAS